MRRSQSVLRPKKRSRLRLFAGRHYFVYRRYLRWLLKDKSVAATFKKEQLPYLAASHQTPLLRKLRKVDMQLQYNKIRNLSLAIPRLNGLTVKPGETFSYWRKIGKPTRRKGYLDGMVLYYGGFRSGVGGGLCQLSNLIYWMTLHTPLTVTERHRHSYDVFPDEQRTQPFGSGATCSYNYLDLQIRNDTEHDYQLCLWLDDTHLYGEWRSSAPVLNRFEVYESSHSIRLEPWGAYVRRNSIRRRMLAMDGSEIRDEPVADNTALMMYAPLLKEASN
ncbi:VanW family protein [Paenibacillus sp. HN-1]|uniref:VanW family protein n=1 Tax=Paenibacillus TaxID=44249 RepID=UPI001CA97C7E|nr:MULTISPECIES: VanW family protein [Paenibacillus]MBY9078486.1 VanW family protein [Paenibacillus sp. CGMCC 1.18879]MBY9082779.1 VanW family protein [Paenibacillus sinensis]